MNTTVSYIIFTDLDGTLLDHFTYSSAQVTKSLARLLQHQFPIIFCSSKTRAEQDSLQTQLNIYAPLIVENGSAIILPKGDWQLSEKLVIHHLDDGRIVIILGQPVDKLWQRFTTICEQTKLNLNTVNQMTAKEVAEITALPLVQAELARHREYSITITTKLSSNQEKLLYKACQEANLQCSQGGRFITITDINADKGRAVKLMTEIYRKKDKKFISVGIGDSANDLPMLMNVDCPYLVKRPDGSWLETFEGTINRLDGIGPLGFEMMVEEILKREFLT